MSKRILIVSSEWGYCGEDLIGPKSASPQVARRGFHLPEQGPL